MKRKPNILLTYRQQWWLLAVCFVISLAVLDKSSALMAADLGSVQTVSSSSDESGLIQDGFNPISFEGASRGDSSNQSLTSLGCLLEDTLIAFSGAGICLGVLKYMNYLPDKNIQRFNNNRERTQSINDDRTVTPSSTWNSDGNFLTSIFSRNFSQNAAESSSSSLKPPENQGNISAINLTSGLTKTPQTPNQSPESSFHGSSIDSNSELLSLLRLSNKTIFMLASKINPENEGDKSGDRKSKKSSSTRKSQPSQTFGDSTDFQINSMHRSRAFSESDQVNQQERAQDKMINKMIKETVSLIDQDRVSNFLRGITYSDKQQLLKMLLYCSKHPIPEKNITELSDQEKVEIMEQIKGDEAEVNLSDVQALCLHIADLQFLDELKKSFLSDLTNKANGGFGSSNTIEQEQKFYKTSITNNVINQSNLRVSQKLDLLKKLLHPLTQQKDRLAILYFNKQTSSLQQELLNESAQSRISMESLLNQIPKGTQKAFLLNIGINPKLTYHQKLDLLVAIKDSKKLTDQEKIINQKNLPSFASNFQHASDCDPAIFEAFFKSVNDGSITDMAITSLKSALSTEWKNFTYRQKWGLVCEYLQNQDDNVRLAILASDSAKDERLSNMNNNIEKRVDAEWRAECWRQHRSNDLAFIISGAKEHADNEVVVAFPVDNRVSGNQPPCLKNVPFSSEIKTVGSVANSEESDSVDDSEIEYGGGNVLTFRPLGEANYNGAFYNDSDHDNEDDDDTTNDQDSSSSAERSQNSLLEKIEKRRALAESSISFQSNRNDNIRDSLRFLRLSNAGSQNSQMRRSQFDNLNSSLFRSNESISPPAKSKKIPQSLNDVLMKSVLRPKNEQEDSWFLLQSGLR